MKSQGRTGVGKDPTTIKSVLLLVSHKKQTNKKPPHTHKHTKTNKPTNHTKKTPHHKQVSSGSVEKPEKPKTTATTRFYFTAVPKHLSDDW